MEPSVAHAPGTGSQHIHATSISHPSSAAAHQQPTGREENNADGGSTSRDGPRYAVTTAAALSSPVLAAPDDLVLDPADSRWRRLRKPRNVAVAASLSLLLATGEGCLKGG